MLQSFNSFVKAYKWYIIGGGLFSLALFTWFCFLLNKKRKPITQTETAVYEQEAGELELQMTQNQQNSTMQPIIQQPELFAQQYSQPGMQ